MNGMGQKRAGNAVCGFFAAGRYAGTEKRLEGIRRSFKAFLEGSGFLGKCVFHPFKRAFGRARLGNKFLNRIVFLFGFENIFLRFGVLS